MTPKIVSFSLSLFGFRVCGFFLGINCISRIFSGTSTECLLQEVKDIGTENGKIFLHIFDVEGEYVPKHGDKVGEGRRRLFLAGGEADFFLQKETLKSCSRCLKIN